MPDLALGTQITNSPDSSGADRNGTHATANHEQAPAAIEDSSFVHYSRDENMTNVPSE
jgi:hypothetical protein